MLVGSQKSASAKMTVYDCDSVASPPVQCAIAFTTVRSSKTLFTSAAGIVQLADLLAHIQAKAVAGVLHHDELFDAQKVVLDVSIPEFFIVANEMRKALAGKAPPRTALVVGSNFLYYLARSHADAPVGDRQYLQVFRSVEEAQSWLIDIRTLAKS